MILGPMLPHVIVVGPLRVVELRLRILITRLRPVLRPRLLLTRLLLRWIPIGSHAIPVRVAIDGTAIGSAVVAVRSAVRLRQG